jgi:hypothetical protein
MHHEIQIRRVGDAAVPQQPMPTMFTGDTVHYTSDAGDVEVQFRENGSPFRATTVGPNERPTVENVGNFRCRCFIDLKDEHRRIGWHTDPQTDPNLSGADHDVPR